LRFKGGAELPPLIICRDEHDDDDTDTDDDADDDTGNLCDVLTTLDKSLLLVPRKEDGAYARLNTASDRTDNKMDNSLIFVYYPIMARERERGPRRMKYYF
jgi:hypothetical protein